jgi:hypothetical protein
VMRDVSDWYPSPDKVAVQPIEPTLKTRPPRGHSKRTMSERTAGFLVGGPGTGKAHLATAISVQAIEHHRTRVRFFGAHASPYIGARFNSAEHQDPTLAAGDQKSISDRKAASDGPRSADR